MWLSARSADHSSQSPIKRRQSVGDPDELMAHEHLGAPGGHAGPALHQGDERLATVEGLVDRRQVADLEGDGDRPGGAGEHGDDVVAPHARVHEADGEQRGCRLVEAAANEPVQGHCIRPYPRTNSPRNTASCAMRATGPTAARMPSLRAKLRAGRARSRKKRRTTRPTYERQRLEPRSAAGQDEGRDEAHRGEHHDETPRQAAQDIEAYEPKDHGPPCCLHDPHGRER